MIAIETCPPDWEPSPDAGFQRERLAFGALDAWGAGCPRRAWLRLHPLLAQRERLGGRPSVEACLAASLRRERSAPGADPDTYAKRVAAAVSIDAEAGEVSFARGGSLGAATPGQAAAKALAYGRLVEEALLAPRGDGAKSGGRGRLPYQWADPPQEERVFRIHDPERPWHREAPPLLVTAVGGADLARPPVPEDLPAQLGDPADRLRWAFGRLAIADPHAPRAPDRAKLHGLLAGLPSFAVALGPWLPAGPLRLDDSDALHRRWLGAWSRRPERLGHCGPPPLDRRHGHPSFRWLFPRAGSGGGQPAGRALRPDPPVYEYAVTDPLRALRALRAALAHYAETHWRVAAGAAQGHWDELGCRDTSAEPRWPLGVPARPSLACLACPARATACCPETRGLELESSQRMETETDTETEKT